MIWIKCDSCRETNLMNAALRRKAEVACLVHDHKMYAPIHLAM